MAKLSDLQLVLLSTGTQHADRTLLPLPPAITATPAATGKAVAALVRRGLAQTTGDGATITNAGYEAIGVELPGCPAASTEPPAPAAPVSTPKAGSKQALVVELLGREGGASLAELVATTGWLPHTTRAALTGLRKKGHDIVKRKVDEVTRYIIAVAA